MYCCALWYCCSVPLWCDGVSFSWLTAAYSLLLPCSVMVWCSNFKNAQRSQTLAARVPQAVARAVAHNCVDVSQLPPKLLRKTFSFVILRMSQKLIFSGCDFGAPTNSKPLPHTCPKQLRAWARARGRADAHCKTMSLVFHMLTFFDRLLGRCRVRADRLIVLAARAPQADGWKTLLRKRIRFFLTWAIAANASTM